MIVLESVRVCNFKAIRDSKTVKLGAFTVFIGNNGSGKSCLLDAMEAYSEIVAGGVDNAFQRHGGFEYAVNQAVLSEEEKKAVILAANNSGRKEVTAMHRKMVGAGFSGFHQPMQFHFRGKGRLAWNLAISSNAEQSKVAVVGEEIVHYGHDCWSRNSRKGGISMHNNHFVKTHRIFKPPSNHTLISACKASGYTSKGCRIGAYICHFVDGWVFLALSPEQMGSKIMQKRGNRKTRLTRNGENIAQYLLDLRDQDNNAFEGVLESLQYVLPYIQDIQPCITRELERYVYLQAREQEYELPGWLLSTGSLRILALLALLRSPQPPSLIAIDEIENGMDPRTLHLLLEEIQAAVRAGHTQIIATTHSPYLLDQLRLEDIILVERANGGEPQFRRPASDEHIQGWARKFAPGRLYTMGAFRSRKVK